MPPRYSYWTIIAGGLPTAFRAAERDELMPTFTRLRDKHPDAEMKWFARGKLWDSPDAARHELEGRRQSYGDRDGERRRPRPGAPERGASDAGDSAKRERDWRPGGEHRDPRQKYADAKKARNLNRRRDKFARKHGEHERPGAARVRPDRDERERPGREQGTAGARGQDRFRERARPPKGRTGPSDRTTDGPPRAANRPRHEGGPREPRRSWNPSGDAVPKRAWGDRNKRPPAVQRPWTETQRERGAPPKRSWDRPRGDGPTATARGREDRREGDAAGGKRPWNGQRDKSRQGGPHRDGGQRRDGAHPAGDQRGGSARPFRPGPPRGDSRAFGSRPPREDDRGRSGPPRRDNGAFRGDRGPHDERRRDAKPSGYGRDRDGGPPDRRRDQTREKGPARKPEWAGRPDRRPEGAKRPWTEGRERTGSRDREDRPRPGGKRPFERPGFERNQGTEEPRTPPPPRGPNREPRPSETPEPTPPPRPSEPVIAPPGPPERGRLVKRPRRP